MWRQPVTWGYSGLLGNESNEQVKALSESVFWQKGRQTLVGFGSWCKIVTSWGWQFILQYLHGFYMFLLHARWLCGKSSGNVFCCSWGLGTDLEFSIFAKHFCGEKHCSLKRFHLKMRVYFGHFGSDNSFSSSATIGFQVPALLVSWGSTRKPTRCAIETPRSMAQNQIILSGWWFFMAAQRLKDSPQETPEMYD